MSQGLTLRYLPKYSSVGGANCYDSLRFIRALSISRRDTQLYVAVCYVDQLYIVFKCYMQSLDATLNSMQYLLSISSVICFQKASTFVLPSELA